MQVLIRRVSRKSEGKGGKSDRGDYTNVKCYNCGEKGHKSPDCKKVKSDKGKALVTKNKSWTDTSDSESEKNYTLMKMLIWKMLIAVMKLLS